VQRAYDMARLPFTFTVGSGGGAAVAAEREDDLPDIRQGLADRATELFERLYDKPTTRRGHQLRWGRKGSLALTLHGRNGPHWHDYESGQGGDMLAVIQYALSTDFADVLDWARDWLGMARRDDRRRPAPPVIRPAVDYDAAQAEKTRRAAEMAAAAAPIAGTVAETYLRQHRGINAEIWPDALGFADAATVRRCTGWQRWRWPALLVRATDAKGTVTGVQLIAVQTDGKAAKHWEHNGKLKLSFGTLAGSAVRLPGDDRALLLAEGPETALSCWHATGIETLANLGSIAKAPLDGVPLDRLIVVCADDDARNAQSNKGLRDAIRGWRRDGRPVAIVKPHALTRRDKSDFNDALRAEGRDAVRARILDAVEGRPAARDLPPLAAAQQQAAEMINAAINRLLNPSPFARIAAEALGRAPFMAARMTTGIGKTEMAIRRIVKEAATGSAKIVYLVPTHRLGAELVGRVDAEAQRQGVNVKVDIWRGRGRPDKPEDALCSQLDTIADAHKAKVDTADVCALCPDRDGCQYLAQFARTAQIWIATHDMLWHPMPAPLKGANLVVIDEGVATRGLTRISGKARLLTEAEIAAAPDGIGVALEADLRAKLMPLRQMLIAAMRDHPDGGLQRERLIAAELTTEIARQARILEWEAKHRVKLDGLSWRNAKGKISKAAKHNRMISRFAALWHAAEDLLEGEPPASGRAVIGNHEMDGSTVRAVQLFGAERIADEWRKTPTLHIDATLDMELLRMRVPHAEHIGEVEAAAPHMRIVQYPDKAFGKYALRNERFLFKVWDWTVAYASRRGGEWGVILPQESETAIKLARDVPSFIKLHHFGATRGIDTLKDVRGLIIIGRPMASPEVVERMAGALSGRWAQPITGEWYPAETVQIRAHDRSVATVEADRHPDSLAEAVRASITVDELIQAIGRVRGVRRTAADPVEVVLLGNVPVPGLAIDEIRQWEPPSIDDAIFAQFGVVLESAGDAATVAGLERETVKKARQKLGKVPYEILLYENVPSFQSATYRRAGSRGPAGRVLYDVRRILDARAWLTERLGPLSHYADVERSAAAADVVTVTGTLASTLGDATLAASGDELMLIETVDCGDIPFPAVADGPRRPERRAAEPVRPPPPVRAVLNRAPKYSLRGPWIPPHQLATLLEAEESERQLLQA
jgi:putative DNA primase/helicase